MVSKPNMWITLENRPLQYFLHLSSKVRQKLQELQFSPRTYQYVTMVTKLFSSYCGAPLVECCCKESNFSDKLTEIYLS